MDNYEVVLSITGVFTFNVYHAANRDDAVEQAYAAFRRYAERITDEGPGILELEIDYGDLGIVDVLKNGKSVED